MFWGTDTVSHRACSCTDLKYLCIHLSIHISSSLSLSLSFQCYLISSWLSLHFFHRINIFPLRMCSPSPDFLFLRPVISLSLLPPPDPLPFPPRCQLAVAFCTQHNTYVLKLDDFKESGPLISTMELTAQAWSLIAW